MPALRKANCLWSRGMDCTDIWCLWRRFVQGCQRWPCQFSTKPGWTRPKNRSHSQTWRSWWVCGRAQYHDQGLVLSTKILRSEKFSEKVWKFQTHHFCQKGQKNDLADVLAWLPD
jgi:hypothetical protein